MICFEIYFSEGGDFLRIIAIVLFSISLFITYHYEKLKNNINEKLTTLVWGLNDLSGLRLQSPPTLEKNPCYGPGSLHVKLTTVKQCCY